MVALSKHTDHMTIIKCYHWEWSAWRTMVFRWTAFDSRTGETCVTGKVKPVPYYLQCPFTTWPHCMIIKHNQLSIFIRAWSVTFWVAEFASEGFNLVCTIWRQREDVRTRVPCNVQCLGTVQCTDQVMFRGSTDKGKYR